MQKIPGGNVMKTLSTAIIGTAIILASCSSAKYAASSEYDDVYYNPNQAEPQAVVVQEPAPATSEIITAEPIVQQQVSAESQAYSDENLSDYEKYRMRQEAEFLGETYEPEGSEALYAEQYQVYDTLNQEEQYKEEKAPVIVNNYNYYNDPNDYYYSSNLRRFSDEYYGWDYYDPYYTDPYYWGGSRIHWGMSMGWGYPYWGFGFSYGYPYYRYSYYPSYWGWDYYDPWYYSPYSSYWGGYYPYYSYYGGSYWNGYYRGYHNGLYDSRYYGAGNYYYGKIDHRHYYGYSRPTSVTTGDSKGSTFVDPKNRSRTGVVQGSQGGTRMDAAVRDARTSTDVRNTTRTSMITPDNKMGGSIIPANNRMPQCFSWTSHAHC